MTDKPPPSAHDAPGAVNAHSAARPRRSLVIDTNVLIHDPTAIFRFDEHDLHLPMVVLEELDASKKGMSEAARNARQASRFLDRLMHGLPKAGIDAGIPLPGLREEQDGGGGRLFFQTREHEKSLPQSLPGKSTDNAILASALALQSELPGSPVTLVSKDINLRIKAAILGVHAEDYYNDMTLTDTEVLYSGVQVLDTNFWDAHGEHVESWHSEQRAHYRIRGPQASDWYPNQFVYCDEPNGFEAVVREPGDESTVLDSVVDYRTDKHRVWGIRARNREQNYAMNLLMDPEIDFVSIVGSAGTGKTLLTLAAGLSQTLDEATYSEIIMTRVTVPLGEDIGFLPGTEEEKMEPWMGALMDNLEVLAQTEQGDSWARAATNDLLRNRIKIRSLNFMRGRTFLNRFIILDEAQNLTAKQMKALITRAGPGTKLVCLGNVEQIDTPYLTETSSGLTFVVNRFRPWGHSGHVTLMRGERSRLAHFASDIL